MSGLPDAAEIRNPGSGDPGDYPEGQSSGFQSTKMPTFQEAHRSQSPPTSGTATPSSPGFGMAGRYGPPRGYPGRGGYYSPPHSPGGRSTASGKEGCFHFVKMTATSKLSRYFRRLLHYRQMDFEFAGWQMIYLLVAPQKVYKNFMYRKRTKDQWARDDPAFLVLLSLALAISSIGFSLILGLSLAGFVKFLLWVVLIDCIFTGIVIATLLWLLANNFLRKVKDRDQDVEWGYCFDVHLNAFFPLLVMLHVVMPLLYPLLINGNGLFSCFVGNSLWFIAIAYYLYITFMGYTALPILRNTQIFLYPFTFVFIFYVAAVTLYWNMSKSIMIFYHYRIGGE